MTAKSEKKNRKWLCKTSTPGSNPGGASNLPSANTIGIGVGPAEVSAAVAETIARLEVARATRRGMGYVNAVVVSIVTALLAAVFWIVGRLFLPMVGSMAFNGAGGIRAVSVAQCFPDDYEFVGCRGEAMRQIDDRISECGCEPLIRSVD